MGKTNALTGDDGHPIPASQAPGVDKHSFTANLCSTGMYAEILSYTLQNAVWIPGLQHQILPPTDLQPVHKGHSLEHQAATGLAPKNRTPLGTQH